MGVGAPSRGDVYLVALDPTRGGEIRKTRPCVVVSPDEMNHELRTFLVAPMTAGTRAYSCRVPCRFKSKDGVVVLDQLRTVDRARLGRRAGRLSEGTLGRVLEALQAMFAD